MEANKDSVILHKAIKARIYPTIVQATLIAMTLGCVRFVYNHFLALWQNTYRTTGKGLSYKRCSAMLSALKKEFAFLTDVDSAALQQALRHLSAAYKNFFEGRADYPNFKKKKNDKSYTTVLTNDNICICGNYLKLPKLGLVKIDLHREVPENYILKSVTVSRTPTGKYFASICFEYENQVDKIDPQNILGLDYSSPYLYIDSNGNEPDYEKPFKKYQNKLAREQRKLSRMMEANIKGYRIVGGKRYPVWKRPLDECKNYQKQKRKVAKIHEKIANCRKDALHKLSLKLAEEYDAIGVEDLNLHALAQSLNLGKATLDNGYGMFVRMLRYKLEDRGKQLIVIDKWYPSTKTCSSCGNIKPVRLNERTYVCPECGTVIDRDWNAAINIREEAKRILFA